MRAWEKLRGPGLYAVVAGVCAACGYACVPNSTLDSHGVQISGPSSADGSKPSAQQGAGGASSSTGAPAKASPSDANGAAPVPAHATFLGRVVHLDASDADHVRMAWSGAAAGVRFTGSAISANLGDANDKPGPNPAAVFDVVVDGKPQASVTCQGPVKRVPLASSLGDGAHTLWLTKRTDADIGVAELAGFVIEGAGAFADPPGRPARHVLVMGASSEVGFGVSGTDDDCRTRPWAVESQTLAWPQRMADLLGADLENLSLSARGLLASASTMPDSRHSMPLLFFQTDPFLENLPWDTNARPIDAVLFNLGANDWHFFGEGPPPQTRFEQTFVSLIKQVRAAYPNAHVYVTLSPTHTGDLRTTFATYNQDIVDPLRGQGDTRVHALAFTPADGVACWGHPDAALHGRMAREAATQVAADVGWPAPAASP